MNNYNLEFRLELVKYYPGGHEMNFDFVAYSQYYIGEYGLSLILTPNQYVEARSQLIQIEPVSPTMPIERKLAHALSVLYYFFKNNYMLTMGNESYCFDSFSKTAIKYFDRYYLQEQHNIDNNLYLKLNVIVHKAHKHFRSFLYYADNTNFNWVETDRIMRQLKSLPNYVYENITSLNYREYLRQLNQE